MAASQDLQPKEGHARPLVYVLILNYQSFEDTLGCLQCARDSDYPNTRILVIDNASPDGSGDLLARQLNKQDLMCLPVNTGYAGGNNAGIRQALQADAKYVFILNPDVRLDKQTISACVMFSEAHQDVGAVNPVQLADDGVSIDSKFRNAILKPSGIDATTYDGGMIPDFLPVKDLLGAALFLPAQAIERVGGFDDLYFAYGEETDLCRRLRYHGLQLAVLGRAPVRHLRTKELSATVADVILFLRLKGIYLGILKDPWRSFGRSIRVMGARFFEEVRGQGRDRYPFNQYPVTRWHSIRAFAWVLLHLFSIREHRRLEKLGRAHV